MTSSPQSLFCKAPTLLLFLLLISFQFHPSTSFTCHLRHSPTFLLTNSNNYHRRNTLLGSSSGSSSSSNSFSSSGGYVNINNRLETIKSLFQPLTSDEKLQTLVAFNPNSFLFGNDNSTLSSSSSSSTSFIHSPQVKVPGCTSTVFISTSYNTFTKRITINGRADSLVTSGIVNLLTSILTNVTVNDAFALDGKTFAEDVGLDGVLNAGRNGGVMNFVRVVQSLVSDVSKCDHSIVGDEITTPPSKHLISPSSSSSPSSPSVALLLSGGVDSSVALHLLLSQNYTVTCFYLKIWLEDESAHLNQCPWEDDIKTCKVVCEQYNVPLVTVSMQQSYKERVMAYTLREAKMGRTPNPDVVCNTRLKFGAFVEYVNEVYQNEEDEDEGGGFRFVASGHYARVENVINSTLKQLKRGIDPLKDQSYFLCGLNQTTLNRALFPLGDYTKRDIRKIAKEVNLTNFDRKDSQGLCFLGKVKYDEFIKTYLGVNPGAAIDVNTGAIVGGHDGLWFHTIGQRKGLGYVFESEGVKCKGPWYVVGKDVSDNVLQVSNDVADGGFGGVCEVGVEDISWSEGLDDRYRLGGVRMEMKVRHGPAMVYGSVRIDDMDKTRGLVVLEEKDAGLACGQWIVFYGDDGGVVGSAVIG